MFLHSMSIAIVGDSFVRRLQDYLRRSSLADLNLEGAHVALFGLGGAAVRGRKRVLPLINEEIRVEGITHRQQQSC